MLDFVRRDRPSSEFVLVSELTRQMLATIQGSGATFEEAAAAIRCVEAILPLAELQSEKSVTVRT